MKTKKVVEDNRPKFKVRVDQRTVITVRSEAAVKSWQQRYPAAVVIN